MAVQDAVPEWMKNKNITATSTRLDWSNMMPLLRDGYIATIKRVAAKTGATVTVEDGIVTITSPELLRFNVEIVAPGNIKEWQWDSWLKIHPGA